MSSNKKYSIGIKIESKERYDKLMNDHSKETLFGLNFKALFEGYPNGYPCLVQYIVQSSPFNFVYATQLTDIVNDGYRVLIELDE